MLTLADRRAFTDLSVIIKMMPEDIRSKIDIKLINLIEKHKDKSYASNIKEYIPIKNQELSEETEALLALIYGVYLEDNN